MDLPSLLVGAILGAIPSGLGGLLVGRRLQRAQRRDDARELCRSLSLDARGIARTIAQHRGSKADIAAGLPAKAGANWAADRIRLAGYLHPTDLAVVEDAYDARLGLVAKETARWGPLRSQGMGSPMEVVEALSGAQAAFALVPDVLGVYGSPPRLRWLPGRHPLPVVEQPGYSDRYPVDASLLARLTGIRNAGAT
jgi:hypothetical protein